MNPLECPHCEQKAIKTWQIFIFPSPFWLSKRCMHCGNKIRFNWNTINLIACSLIAGIIIGNILIRIFKIDSIILDAILLSFFLYLPFLFGKRLFVSEENKGSNQDQITHG